MNKKTRRNINKFIPLIAVLMTFIFWNCSKDITSQPGSNNLPETHLFLSFPDSLPDSLAMPDTSTSTKIIHWYGDDVDGEVVGFYHAWDETLSDTAWTYTTDNMDTFYVPIREAYGEFTFYIKAVDNQDGIDPSPAYITFPVINSPPAIQFPVDFEISYLDEDFIGFNIMTFGWNGSDPDGDETIVKYEYYLGDGNTPVDTVSFDTLTWIELPTSPQRLTLSDLSVGEHRVFFRATDIAGALSDVIFYPDTTATWTVQEPIGDVLYIDDNSFTLNPEEIYIQVLDSMYGANYSHWNIQERTYYYPSDITTAFSNFDKIVWNSGSYPHFRECESSLYNFLNNDGKLVVSTTYADEDTTIYGFLPIDSVTATGINRPRIYSVDSRYLEITGSMQYPISYVFGFIPGVPEFLPADSVTALYRAENVDTGEIIAARYPATGTAKVIMFSFPIQNCQDGAGFQWLLPFILTEEF
ncbi:MAG: hypothetical protein GY855_14615 [candidate division Zixibacteria bacterium]|nr:hypothetical protein [candidate division Zixibacteria bacterium]